VGFIGEGGRGERGREVVRVCGGERGKEWGDAGTGVGYEREQSVCL